jgi:Icc-related predicted phosphoesterase
MALFGRSRAKRTRILFATDLHGSEVVFRKFLNAARVYEAEVAILGGDLTGKKLVPVVEDGDHWTTNIGGQEHQISDEGELATVMDRIRNLGQYPVCLPEDEHARLQEDATAVDDLFERECVRQVERWMQLAAERLEEQGIPIYVTGGNDDLFSVEQVLDAAPYVVNAEGRLLEIVPGVEMISTGYGNITPWDCPRDISEEELGERIEAMTGLLTDPPHAVFNFHVPPFESGLDQCARLDTSVSPPRPIAGEEIAAGSTAVRAAIERFGPVVSLHGHIHEARGVQRLGETTCVNPGSEYGEGVLRTAVVDLVPGGGDVTVQLLAA